MKEPQPPPLVLRGQPVDLAAPVLLRVVDLAKASELAPEVAVMTATSGASSEMVGRPRVIVGVETSQPEVAAAALAAGAAIIDPERRLDTEVVRLCAEAGAGLVVRPEAGIRADVVELLAKRLAEAVGRGMPRDATIVDPGFVPGLGRLEQLRELGRPLVFTPARPDLDEVPASPLAGMLAAVGHLAAPGTILRVPEDAVDAVADYLAVADVLAGRTELAPDTQLPIHLRREPSPGLGLPPPNLPPK